MADKENVLMQKIESLHTLSWDELTTEILQLEIEFSKIKKFLKPSEVQLYQDFIYMYEVEKSMRLPIKRSCSDYTDYMMGQRSAFAAWVEISEKEINRIVYGNHGVTEDEEDDEDFM